MATHITNPRDPRLLDPEHHAALAMDGRTFRGLVATASRHGAKIVDATETGDILDGATETIDIETVQANIAAMLATGSGERFSLGDYEMAALRFIVNGRACSILYVEDYPQPYPCIVDGHMTDRATAITLWLGDGDTSEHPDLHLDLEA